MVWKSGQIFFPFCHNPRVWQTDGQTDWQIDRILIARPRLHSMPRGKNLSFHTHCQTINDCLDVTAELRCSSCRTLVSIQLSSCHTNKPVKWLFIDYCCLYTVSQKKLCHYITFVHISDKCWPIFKILLRLYSPKNFQQNPGHNAHHTLNVSLHAKLNFKIQPFLVPVFTTSTW